MQKVKDCPTLAASGLMEGADTAPYKNNLLTSRKLNTVATEPTTALTQKYCTKPCLSWLITKPPKKLVKPFVADCTDEFSAMNMLCDLRFAAVEPASCLAPCDSTDQ